MNPAHLCPLCGKLMTVITQTYPAKYNIPDRELGTCFTPKCKLEHVTLTIGEHAKLSADQIDQYQANR